ncbi:MAG: hypothetical protein NT027_13285 [Proteobacteria bacterium]|nr:hypothetical protein [Pseudomonadota bacterium]
MWIKMPFWGFIIAVAIASSLTSCKRRQLSKEKSDLWEVPSLFGLMHVIHQEVVRVCILKVERNDFGEKVTSGATAKVAPVQSRAIVERKKTIELPKYTTQTMSDIKTSLESAIRKWIAPVAEFSGKSVIRKIDFLDESNGCVTKTEINANQKIADLSVIVDPAVGVKNNLVNDDIIGAAAWVNPHLPGKVWMYLGVNVKFGIVLHEMGHVLGLDDSYNKRSSDNNPASVMHYGPTYGNDELFPTDVEGIQFAFCRIHAKANAQACSKLKSKDVGGNYPEVNAKGENVYQLKDIGIIFEEAMTSKQKDVYSLRDMNKYPRILEEIFVRVGAIDEGIKTKLSPQVELGDQLVSVNGTLINRLKDIDEPLSYTKGGVVKLRFYRAGNEGDIDVKLLLQSSDSSQSSNNSKDILIGTVVEALEDTDIRVQANTLGKVPTSAWLVVKAISDDKRYFWVTYRGTTGWITAKSVVKKSVQKIEFTQ